MKYIVILFILTILFSCKKDRRDSIKISTPKVEEKIIKKKPVNNVLQKRFDKLLLNGVWSENKDENALFYIENDSIYYIEHQDYPYFLEFKKSSFYVHYDDYISEARIIKLDKDSLVYKGNSDIIRLFRVTE